MDTHMNNKSFEFYLRSIVHAMNCSERSGAYDELARFLNYQPVAGTRA